MLTAISSFSGFSVNNIEEARVFYVDTLGLKLLDDSMGLQLELPGGGQHFIYEKADHVPADFTVLNFVVDNINDAVDHLVNDHGIKFERYDNMPAPQDERGVLRGKDANQGPNIAWFTDPAGNVLSLIED
jgi:catechol 2,3-dioxygenase-like lactoylglutathione lyase family enzyme